MGRVTTRKGKQAATVQAEQQQQQQQQQQQLEVPKSTKKATGRGRSNISKEDSDNDGDSDNEDDMNELLRKARSALVDRSNSHEQQQAGRPNTGSSSGNGVSSVNLAALRPPMSFDDAEFQQSLYISTSSTTGQAKLHAKMLGNVSDIVPAALLAKAATSSLAGAVDESEMTREDLGDDGAGTQRKTQSQRIEEREKTAGKKWFDMQAVEMTPELEQDLAVLRMRGVLDKTRHFKRTSKKDKMLQTKYMQVGTVVEGATEFYSSRLTKKQRKPTLVDQLLADHETRSYFKGKVKDIQTARRSGVRKMKPRRTPGSGKKH